MFKDEYRREMDKQKPSDETLTRLETEMRKAQAEKTTGRKKAYRYQMINAAAAIAACIVLIIAAVNPAINLFNRSNIDDITGKPGTGTQGGKKPVAAADYEELYSVINKLATVNVRNDGEWAAEEEAAAPGAPTDSKTGSDYNSGSNDYSGTNLQVAGVEEADVIKTDGKYIYAVSPGYIYIVSADNGELEVVSKLARMTQDGNRSSQASEIYINGDRLIILTNVYYSVEVKYDADGSGREPAIEKDYAADYYYYYNYRNDTIAEVYDITDKANPTLVNKLGQSGYYTSSRMIGGMLYLITSYTLYGKPDPEDPDTFVPSLYDGAESSLVKAADICVYGRASYAQYTVISGIDTSGDGEIVSSKSLLGYGSTIYASTENIYIASYGMANDGDYYYNTTDLVRVSIDEGKVEVCAEGTVPGSILNQFSMDEYNGTFRIVTTLYGYTAYIGEDIIVYDEGNTASDTVPARGIPTEGGVSVEGAAPDSAVSSVTSDRTAVTNTNVSALYTLDSDLNIIGKIEDLAPGERVYSVRFSGDTGYFVTFRQVDPLFTVDLSDPENPTILSELKIPGFSEYLHPYAEGLLFGLGNDADETSGSRGYMKLSMFDVSDPANVTEKDKLILDGYYYSEASYNHKAILIDSRKNIIAFPADDKYLVYTYSEENGFELLEEISLYSNFNGYYYGYYYNMRGLYIGNYLYVFGTNIISSYSLTDFGLCDSEILETADYKDKYYYDNETDIAVPEKGEGVCFGSSGAESGATSPGEEDPVLKANR